MTDKTDKLGDTSSHLWRCAVTRPGLRGQRACVFQVRTNDGSWSTLKSWQWDSGAPSVSQLEDAVATITQEIRYSWMLSYGVQERLQGFPQ